MFRSRFGTLRAKLSDIELPRDLAGVVPMHVYSVHVPCTLCRPGVSKPPHLCPTSAWPIPQFTLRWPESGKMKTEHIFGVLLCLRCRMTGQGPLRKQDRKRSVPVNVQFWTVEPL